MYTVSALLELNFFAQIETMIPQIQDKGKLLDLSINSTRKLLGEVIVIIDLIPELASVIVSMDAEGMSWCKAASGPPNADDVIQIANGQRSVIDFDVFAVRHFILRLHAILLLVPISSGQRDKKWSERKEKTEVLLSLCGNLAVVQN